MINRGDTIGVMQLAKTYSPGEHEQSIYDLWESHDSFKPTGKGDHYSIVMPPPNANANLHIGYALTAALEDIPTRYHRMRGHDTLLLPGADHAGFETQSVYEKHLSKQGKSRFDFSREDLYRDIYDFVALNRGSFENQFRRLGISCDWSRFTFTLDEKIVNQAYATFKKMWDDGLIYRGERLVNYCTFHGTGFADVEVLYSEEKGNLWYIGYPLVDGSGEVVVATTRPETMLGDTAVAVHPDDERYREFVGKTVKLPLTDREIPIISDSFVEQEYGTGAVKITPAHDPNDFDCGERHDLPKVTVIDLEGKMTSEVPDEFRGLSVKDARAAVVEALEKGEWLRKTEELTHNVGKCYKCGTVIEPLLREQWFVDMKPLAKPAIKALKDGKITFYPEQKRDQLIGYLEGLRDWNISRQIVWGIPIPAFQNVDNTDDWIYDDRVTEDILEIDGKTYRRDPDVFDTWFSSSSWPYATLGLGTDDFKKYYPLSLMETGGEILYPWVSRKIMLGLYLTGKVPFESVYIHGYVMAEDGSKMSKSVGNVVDPMPVIDEYGSDALRMGIIAGRSPAVNRGYDRRRIEDARNFANKLWNIARYIGDRLGDDYTERGRANAETSADAWVLARLNDATASITKALDEYRFAEGYDTLYHFVWDDVADWYIEASKSTENKDVLAFILEQILKLAHPFAPFVTETIWQELPYANGLLISAEWPKTSRVDNKKAKEFDELQAIIIEARAITKTLGARNVSMYYSDVPFLAEHAPVITRMAKLKDVTEVDDGTGLFLTSTPHRCWLDIDPALASGHIKKLEEEKQAASVRIKQLEGRLSNKSYVTNAPKEIVAETRKGLQEASELLTRLSDEQERFARLSER